MLALIAESKTMTHSPVNNIINAMPSPRIPEFEEEASKIAGTLSRIPVSDLAEEIGVTQGLAVKASKLFYDFPFKDSAQEAISLFQGDVFRALDFFSLSEEQRNAAYKKIKIISSLYGILNPDDTIKPYRLEFNSSCLPLTDNLIKFWKPKVTISLGKQIKEKNETLLLNLLPGDAAKIIDWKLLKNFSTVFSPSFKIIDESGRLKTPNSGKIKEARGKFLRDCLINNYSYDDLFNLNTDFFYYSPEDSKPGLPIYVLKQ